MNKNPFSLYDFLGYLFPGLIALMLVIYIVYAKDKGFSIEEYFYISNFMQMLDNIFTSTSDVNGVTVRSRSINILESTTLIVVLSYIAGHIVAYVSSRFIEYFSKRLYGYPSVFLFNRKKITEWRRFHNYFIAGLNWGDRRKFNYILAFWRVIIILVLLPLSVLMIPIIGTPISKYITRPFDPFIISALKEKRKQLNTLFGIVTPKDKDSDYHHVVMDYVYLNVPNCQRKADNYVAIYGFLRAITLIACLFFNYLIVVQVFTFFECVSNEYATLEFDGSAALVLLGIFVLCNTIHVFYEILSSLYTRELYGIIDRQKSYHHKHTVVICHFC